MEGAFWALLRCGRTAELYNSQATTRGLAGKRGRPFRRRGPQRSALWLALKLAVAAIGERPQDGAGAAIDHLTNVHGQGEN